MAKQASGSVVVKSGDTMVLSTATVVVCATWTSCPDRRRRRAHVRRGQDPWLLLPSRRTRGEKGTLTAPIDRPIRPLFPKAGTTETQLVTIPMSVDHVASPTTSSP